jgi:radical SAM-linked protein
VNGHGQVWLIAFSRNGSARYLSHLDTARALQRTLARAGVVLELSQGMRPKARLALGLPLPVGVAALYELAVAGVADAGGDQSTVLARLGACAPPGIGVVGVEPQNHTLRLRPERAVYEGVVAVAAVRMSEAVARFLASPACTVTRTKPDGERPVDVRRAIEKVVVEAEPQHGCEPRTRLGFVIRHRDDGAARPAELLAALGACGAPPVPTVDAAGRPAFSDLVRIGVTYKGMKPLGAVEDWLEKYDFQH